MSRPRFLPVGLLAAGRTVLAPALRGATLALALLACKADIPDGVYRCDSDQDCPHRFSCRADDSGDRYCFSGSSGSKPNADRDGGSRGGGSGATGGHGGSGSGNPPGNDGGAGSDARDGGAGSGASGSGAPTGEQAPPTALGFSSGGERRAGQGLVLYGDGFERSGRDCSADGVLCVTGGFAP